MNKIKEVQLSKTCRYFCGWWSQVGDGNRSGWEGGIMSSNLHSDFDMLIIYWAEKRYVGKIDLQNKQKCWNATSVQTKRGKHKQNKIMWRQKQGLTNNMWGNSLLRILNKLLSIEMSFCWDVTNGKKLIM